MPLILVYGGSYTSPMKTKAETVTFCIYLVWAVGVVKFDNPIQKLSCLCISIHIKQLEPVSKSFLK